MMGYILSFVLATQLVASVAFAETRCEDALSPGGKVLRLLTVLGAGNWDVELVKNIGQTLAPREKIQLLDTIEATSPEAKRKRYVREAVAVLDIPFEVLVDESARKPHYLSNSPYMDPERLKQLEHSLAPETRLAFYKALLTSPKVSSEIAQKIISSLGEDARLELAIHYLRFMTAQINDNTAALDKLGPKVGIFTVADRFELASPHATLALASAYLEAGVLYGTQRPDDGGGVWLNNSIYLRGYSENSKAALARFWSWVAAWPPVARDEFALAFVEAAKPLRLVYLENLQSAFGLTDPDVIAKVNTAQLKTFLKRWGDGNKFEDLGKIFTERGLSPDSKNLVRWSLDYPLIGKHVPYAKLVESISNFAKAQKVEPYEILGDPQIMRQLLYHYGVQVVAGYLDVENINDLPIRPAVEHPDEPSLVHVIDRFMTTWPGVIPEILLPTLLSGTGDRDTLIYLLNVSFKHVPQIESARELSFFKLLCFIFPWDAEQVEKWSQRGRRDVLSIAADLYNLTGKDIFEYLPLETRDFPPAAKLSDLLELVRNNYQLAVSDEALRITSRNPEPKALLLGQVVKALVKADTGDEILVSASNVEALTHRGKEEFIAHIQAELHFLPIDPDTAFVAFFGHLAGYDAGYYGYAWADAIAADMATVFEQSA